MTGGASPGSIPDWLAHRARVTPAREALVAAGRSWTFRELDAVVTRLAQVLHERGVRGGDRVASLLHNGAAPVLLLHALLRLGATLVPLNVRLTQPEAGWQLNDCGAGMVVVEPQTAPLVQGAFTVLDSGELLRSTVAADSEPCALRLAHDAEHVLAIIYTSGTTGRPKGAKLTVANAWWSAIGSALNLGMLPDDRWLAVLPLFHVGGLAILLRSVIGGFAAVVHESFDAGAVNQAIDDEGVTVVSVVAVMLQRMLDARGHRRYPPTLRCVLLGGGPAPPTLLERCAAMGVPVVQTYGLTETSSQLATLAPEDALRMPGASGKPLYPNALRIVGETGVCGAGVDGEIQVRGPVVIAGYTGDADAAHLTPDGWLRTGDIGRVDAEGFLYVIDRRDDLVITGGENVYPAEVEAALLAHPAVIEAGVVGLPDERWGQRVIAFVKVTDDLELDAASDVLRDHCRSRLAGFKVPREVRIVAHDLPRTASGKLRRAALREQAGVRSNA